MLNSMGISKDIAGQLFGRLTAIKQHKKYNGRWIWECLCSCGATTYLPVGALTTGHTKSCGCFFKEKTRMSKNKRHGETRSLTYCKWANMKSRCLDINSTSYKVYGGKGITISKRWMHYENFVEDMGRCPSKKYSLDRINNKKGYSKANCKWSTFREQALNRSMTIWFTKNGEKLCLKDWAAKLKIRYKWLSAKLKKVENKRKFFDSLFTGNK